MKNLQTNIYLALFSDFEYLVPSQSYKIFIRISSEKTYCKRTGLGLQAFINWRSEERRSSEMHKACRKIMEGKEKKAKRKKEKKKERKRERKKERKKGTKRELIDWYIDWLIDWLKLHMSPNVEKAVMLCVNYAALKRRK